MEANLTTQRKGEKMVRAFEHPLSAPTYLPSVVATEIAALRKEAQAFKRVRAALRTRAPDQAAGRIVFEKAGALCQSFIFCQSTRTDSDGHPLRSSNTTLKTFSPWRTCGEHENGLSP
jgi:hypothetical protein